MLGSAVCFLTLLPLRNSFDLSPHVLVDAHKRRKHYREALLHSSVGFCCVLFDIVHCGTRLIFLLI